MRLVSRTASPRLLRGGQAQRFHHEAEPWAGNRVMRGYEPWVRSVGYRSHMYRTPTSGLSQEFLTGQRVWASLTVAGSVLAIMGMIVLPWFNKAAEFRAGAGLTFFQWHQQTHSMIPYWVALIAYAAVAVAAFTKPTQWSAWAGIVLACITFADYRLWYGHYIAAQ